MPSLHPESKFIICWEALIILVTLYNCFIIPFRFAFNATAYEHWFLLDFLADLILISDIFLRFHISYIYQGELIKDKNKIRQHYQKNTFQSNLFASVPLDILIYLFFPNTPLSVLGLFRTPRLLRLPQCFLIFKKWDNNVYLNSGLIRILELLIIIFLIDHWIACLWFWVGIVTGQSGDSWLYNDELNLHL